LLKISEAMRFKSKLSLEQIQLLCNVVTPLSKLNSSDVRGGAHSINNRSSIGIGGITAASSSSWNGGSVFHIDEDHVRISLRSAGEDGIFCFVEFLCSELFLEHKIESAAENAILFELDMGHFRTAMQSVLTSLRGGAGGIGSSSGGGGGSRTPYQPLHNSMGPDNYSSQPDNEHDNQSQVRPQNSRLFSTAAGSSTVVMKLAKRGGLPCLCLDCFGYSLEVHHAIPIKVMRVTEVNYYLPPRISIPDVQLELPPGPALRTVVERLRSMSQYIFLEGSMMMATSASPQDHGGRETGELCLFVDGNGASTRVYFNKLVPRFEETKAQQQAQSNNETDDENPEPASRPPPTSATTTNTACTLKVDSKTLQSCLAWQSTLFGGGGGDKLYGVSSAILCMVDQEMLVIHVLFHPRALGFFTYYVPVMYMSPEDEVG
jgi:HUS1 checkpoint protein